MSHARKPSDYVLNKKMPDNPRYKNVKPIVDTGASLRRYLESIEELRRNFKYRKDELFKRIKLHICVSLMYEVAKLKLNKEVAGDPTGDSNDVIPVESNIGEDGETKTDQSAKSTRPSTPKSTLQSLISGVGEMDVNDDQKACPNSDDKLAMLSSNLDDPYLLLDVREPEEFSQCHIITAENYPISMLSRTMNFESKSLLAFKNKANKIIVMYDEDETRAPKAATTLVQRGYDNVYMLSGGLKLAVEKFPRGLVTGIPPQNCFPLASSTKVKRSASTSSLQSCRPKLSSLEMKENFTQHDLNDLEGGLIGFSGGSTCSSLTSVSSSYATSKATVSTTTPRATRSQATIYAKSKPWK